VWAAQGPPQQDALHLLDWQTASTSEVLNRRLCRSKPSALIVRVRYPQPLRKSASLATTQSGEQGVSRSPFVFFNHSALVQEQQMIRLIGFVTGIVVGALGTLVVEHPQKVVTKVRQAADLVRKKVREAYEAGEPPDDNPAAGPGEKAA
jgi:hypothetical protein